VRHALQGREHIEIDLLKSDVLLKYKRNPELLRREIEFLLKDDRTMIVFIKRSLPFSFFHLCLSWVFQQVVSADSSEEIDVLLDLEGKTVTLGDSSLPNFPGILHFFGIYRGMVKIRKQAA
jgi:hypothetical protein